MISTEPWSGNIEMVPIQSAALSKQQTTTFYLSTPLVARGLSVTVFTWADILQSREDCFSFVIGSLNSETLFFNLKE